MQTFQNDDHNWLFYVLQTFSCPLWIFFLISNLSLFFFVNEIKKYCFAIFVELKQWQFALEDVEKFPIQPISDSKINSNVCSLVGFWQVVQAKNF